LAAEKAEKEAAEEEAAQRRGGPSEDAPEEGSAPGSPRRGAVVQPGRTSGGAGGASPGRRGSMGRGRDPNAPPTSRQERERMKKGRLPGRPNRKGRMAIFGALSPMQAQSEVTDEAKASVMGLLKMAQEIEELRAQIRHMDHRIQRAKNTDGKRQPTRNLEDAEDDDAPDENKDLRKEVQRQQRELNTLRKRWADEKGGREKKMLMLNDRMPGWEQPCGSFSLERRRHHQRKALHPPRRRPRHPLRRTSSNEGCQQHPSLLRADGVSITDGQRPDVRRK